MLMAANREMNHEQWHWTLAGRFCMMNKRALKLLQAGLHRDQKVLERLHDGFARWTKGLWSCFKPVCIVNKRYLNVCMTVLHVYKNALKLVQGALRRVRKGFERCKNGFVHRTIWAWSNFKFFLRSVQFNLEVGSSRFCVVYNLGMKLLQGGWYTHQNHCDLKSPWVVMSDQWSVISDQFVTYLSQEV